MFEVSMNDKEFGANLKQNSTPQKIPTGILK